MLVDTAAYYQALREAMLLAERSIVIVGWDVDSRVQLVPETQPEDGHPPTLLAFLNSILAAKRSLHVHVLSWDFAMIYTFERELLPSLKFAHGAHRRLHHALDGEHPATASQHQKIVVIDDRVAFCGGIDLTIRRWDTPEHKPNDPRRHDPGGVTYGPMHDVQMAVDGPAALALGELCRARWQVVTGKPLAAPGAASGRRLLRRTQAPLTAADRWPPSASVDMRDVDVGIARTVAPMTDTDPGVHEVLTVTLELIRSAKHTLYIENQYLTSAAAVKVLVEILEADEGPELLLVLPKAECGWMEKSSMGVLRSNALATVRAADRHGRLHVYFPVPDSAEETSSQKCEPESAIVNVHSKVMIADDRVLKIGSSNLSNRSMGLDTECDLVIEAAEADTQTRASINTLMQRLLAEHLGMAEDELAARTAELGSPVKVVEARRGKGRRLEPLVDAAEAPMNLAVLDGVVVDPERPVSAELFMERLVPERVRRSTRRSLWGVALSVFGVLGIVLLLRFTPLRELSSIEQLTELIQALRADTWGPLYVVAVFVVASLIFVPITVLIAATAVALDPLPAFGCALLGSLLSAAAAHFIGHALGRRPLLRLFGARLARLRPHIERAGLRAIVVARLLPVGNFTAINLLAGALVVPFRTYMLGNLIGLLPGLLGLSLLADRVLHALRSPTALNLGALLLACAVLAAALLWIKRGLAKRQARISELPAPPQERRAA